MDSNNDYQIVCNSCGVRITTEEGKAKHYKSEWHRHNVKRRCQSMVPISEALFLKKVGIFNDTKRAVQPVECLICRKKLKSQAVYETHLLTNKHLKKAAHLKKTAKPTSATTNPEIDGIKEIDEGGGGSFNDMDTSDVKVSNDGKQDGKEDEDIPDIPETKTGIPLGDCLFCPAHFSNTKLQNSLNHMLTKHGFFIPFIDWLTDLKGLLLYIGEKIGIGHVCLYCNSQAFKSLDAVTQHMSAKGHCKINLDDEDEFLDFYSFISPNDDDNETDEASTPVDGQANESDKQMVGPDKPERKRHLAGQDPDTGELIMTDGSRIGHRSLIRAYKQNLRPMESREAVLINQMMKKYIAFNGYHDKSKFNEHSSKMQNWVEKQRCKIYMKANNQKHFRDQMLQ